ncbi:MAG: hypothetical protein CL489_08680 [Acidobacteria bacterium]|nr:hypothetical protein [Acidobacteriota bacterium]|tara:strand:- start:31414 stop:31869 length:456 start_codon:yes stop_codon:yes gene_type:complete
MDIGSGNGYPSSKLSNFAPHSFTIDGIECGSMEGFLQSLKFKSIEMQIQVCSLFGKKAKFRGKRKKWWRDQILYWRGVPIYRHSDVYQNLITRAYDELAKNEKFKNAIIASKDAVYTHSMGKNDPSKTILTETEFCGQLNRVRNNILKGDV